MSATGTLLLYIAIWTFTVLTAFWTQKTVCNFGISAIQRKIPFYISFLIPWFFSAFTNVGYDYVTYARIYSSVTWENFDSLWVEPGYALLNLIIKLFVDDSTIGIIVIKTISMLLVYKAIYDYREKIHVGFAIMGYLSLIYLDSYCMIRINLAAGLILYALSLYQNYNRKWLAVVLIVCAMSIHYSALIFVACFAVYILFFRKATNYIFKLCCMCLLVLAAAAVAVPLMDFVLDIVPFLAKYGEKYGLIESSGLGIMQILFHLPFVLVAIETRQIVCRTEHEQGRLISLALVLAPFSLFFGSMAYSVQVIGRSYVFFIYIWSIGLPAYYMWRKKMIPRDSAIVGILITVWSAFRFYLYLHDHLISAGIDRYFFIWQ